MDFKDVIGLSEEGMYTFENVVGFDVSMAVVPPAFHDSGVIPKDEEIGPLSDDEVKGADEEFEADRFGPADVASGSSGCLPAGEEPPGSPERSNCDADAKTRARIGEGEVVDEGGGGLYGALDVALL